MLLGFDFPNSVGSLSIFYIHGLCMGKFIFKYLSYEKKRLLITWLLYLVASLLCLIPAALIGRIIDLATKRNMECELLLFALALGLIYVTMAVMNFVAGNIAIHAKMSIYRKMCKDTYQVMMNLSMKEWGKISSEAVYQSCVEDVKAIRVISVEKLLEVFSYFVSAFGAFFYIGSIYWPLLFLLGVIYGGYFLPAYLLGKRQTKREEKARQTEYDLRKKFVEIFQRIRLIRIYNMEEYEIKCFTEKSDDWEESKYQLVQWYNLFKSIPRFLDSFAPALVFLIGGYIIARGEITIGEIAGITVVLPYLNAPIRYYSSYSMQLREAFAKLKDVYQLHTTLLHEEEFRGKRQVDVIKDITLEEITVRNDGKTILENFTYQFERGKKYGITGATGAGKSTLFLLLLGLIEPENGKLMINGIPFSDIDQIDFRKKFCVLQQMPYLFNKGVKENVWMYEDVGAGRIERYEEMFGLNQIESFSGELGENGIRLSGGQKQMLGAVRLLASEKDWYLCDEITSAMDNKRRKFLVDQLLQQKENVLFITHQLDLMNDFDEILVLDSGRLAEAGTHAALLQQNGKYKELYDKYEFK